MLELLSDREEPASAIKHLRKVERKSLALYGFGAKGLTLWSPSEESIRASSTAMTKTDAYCLRLLPNRRLGPFHRLRDFHHRCPCFRMALELSQRDRQLESAMGAKRRR